ncbi:MAG: hypothetical protein MRY79_00955 [Alphaproteobacteria bacterium]|nr:hypothetical protein [Alphaproteobacteria bacterium]
MAVPIDSIQYICQRATRDVEHLYPGLSLFFIIHGTGKLRESLALSEHEIVSHPAGKAAQAVIRKHSKGENSSFLGMAIASESKMLGFKRRDHLMAIFTVNKDEFDHEDEALATIHHLTWHAIDLYEIRQQPQYRHKFKSGPMVPKRSALNLSKANLQADMFAGILAHLRGSPDVLTLIAKKRGVDSLLPITGYKAEDFPSIIALEATRFSLKELKNDPPTEEEHVKIARQTSIEIGYAFEEHNIREWWNYAIPAQDMAWRGYKKEQILGAALNTSEDPFVRSIGYLVKEVTDIEDVPASALENTYNCFIDPEKHVNLHREMVDAIFQEAITQGLEESSSRPILDAANAQNEDLTQGRILGWCANALQDAAKAFERALLNGASPAQAAKMQFEGNRKEPSWEDLKKLGKEVIDQRKQGIAVTMGHIAEVCHNNPAFAPVLDSLKITMSDPAYIQKLEAANDLAVAPAAPAPEGPAPQAPVPKAPAPKGPAPKGAELTGPAVQPPAAPTLGGNNRVKELLRQRQMMAQKQQEDQDGKGGDTPPA